MPFRIPPPIFVFVDTIASFRAELDEHKYLKAVKISAARLAAINLHCHEFHGEWNYTIDPKRSTK